ncbi:helix-turn-helix domain-containing protein [Streptomyces sp. NPDC058066]|uniref:helix-turn-helix domain-containing protein n=1 Tax=Streptomyces sp. NPDC058066 TaxID=3346323 RepID=UPI0036EEC513
MPPTLVSAADAAYYTGRPVGTIWRWASEGRITRYGEGRNVRYDVRELPCKTVDEWTDEVTLGAPPSLPEGARAA